MPSLRGLTNEIIHNAKYAEMVMVYGNRFRSKNTEVENRLDIAKEKFYRGDYKNSLDISLSAISLIDKNIDIKFFGKDDD